jgi:hypothetical protein
VHDGRVVRRVASAPAYPRAGFQDVHLAWYWSRGGGEGGTIVAVSEFMESFERDQHRVMAFDVASGELIGEHTLENVADMLSQHDISRCGRWLYSALDHRAGGVIVRTNLQTGVKETVRDIGQSNTYNGVNASGTQGMIVLSRFSDLVDVIDAETHELIAQLALPDDLYGADDTFVSPEMGRGSR